MPGGQGEPADAASREDPRGVGYERLLGVATLYAAVVGGFGVVAVAAPSHRTAATAAVLACTGVYLAFGALLVYRAGSRVG